MRRKIKKIFKKIFILQFLFRFGILRKKWNQKEEERPS
jgi:hypothetical protein